MGCYNSKPKCVICYKNAEKVLWPCGHICLCGDCAQKLTNSRSGSSEYRLKLNLDECGGVHCPICRQTAIPSNLYPN